jgi:SAM-dependent methyltransferase
MDEASKTSSLYPQLLNTILDKGRILDIGAGIDPITKDAVIFDKAQGDAQEIQKYFSKESFDTVFSSHCLEHMVDPRAAIANWFSLVKIGGHLITIVPDEDLYEQGHFPSIFNSDHKSTFTISKSNSWSPVSINCLDLFSSLGGEIVYLKQQSDNYNFSLQSHNKLGLYRSRLGRKLLTSNSLKAIALKLRLIPIDQTSAYNFTLSQICIILKKTNEEI